MKRRTLEHPQHQAGVTPQMGVDAYREAAAAIRAYARGDNPGTYTLLANTEAPRHVAAALTTLAVTLARRAGLDDAQLDQLLTDITTDVFDAILDSLVPAAGEVRDA